MSSALQASLARLAAVVFTHLPESSRPRNLPGFIESARGHRYVGENALNVGQKGVGFRGDPRLVERFFHAAERYEKKHGEIVAGSRAIGVELEGAAETLFRFALNLSKAIPWGDKRRLELRWEALNVFNHPQLVQVPRMSVKGTPAGRFLNRDFTDSGIRSMWGQITLIF